MRHWAVTRQVILRLAKLSVVAGLILCLFACAAENPAPVVNLSHQSKRLRSQLSIKGAYVVQNGETLFSIAKRSGHDPQKLAILNGIQPPYKIKTGQKLVFSERLPRTFNRNPAMKSSPAVPVNHSKLSATPKVQPQTPPQTLPKQLATDPQKLAESETLQKSAASGNSIRWRWPVQGRILRSFQASGKGKGIDIAGTLGKPVKAAAEGVVVYSGNGLKGYGNLIIIKHDEDFLSAYAHNRELRVKEGERVRLGQEIALMGQSDAEQVKVHFEIRYKGKPVNPLKFLPKV